MLMKLNLITKNFRLHFHDCLNRFINQSNTKEEEFFIIYN